MSPRLAANSDRAELARILAGAFRDDPVFAHMLPPATTPRRDARLRRFFALDVHRSLRLGGAWTNGGTGAAVWYPPGDVVESFWSRFWSGPKYMRIFGRHLMLASHVEAALRAHHPRQPHWYLLYLGAVPAAQGTGVGTSLLVAKLAECDASGVPAYLEATTQDNRRLYARHGFVDMDPLPLPDGGPAMYPMWRDPVRSARVARS